MDLERVTAKLRPRSAWEAIDLGLVFLQANAKTAYLSMLASTWPFVLLAFIVLWFTQSTFIAFLVFWWAKPLYDRVVLHHLGRALFGEKSTGREILFSALGLMFKGAGIQAIAWQRFDLARSFNLPVWLLEGLRGKHRYHRSRVLQDRGRSSAVWLGITCVHLSFMLQLSIFALIAMFVPEEVWGDYDLLLASITQSNLMNWLGMSIYLLAEFIVEPLFVASGFTLYLNRRTDLEAWDIELAFRRLVQRRTRAMEPETPSKVGILLLSGLLGLFAIQPKEVQAQETDASTEPQPTITLTREDAQQIAKALEKSSEFSAYEKDKVWVKNDIETPDRNDVDLGFLGAFGKFMAKIFEIGIWVFVGLFIIFVYVKRDYWLRFFRAEAISSESHNAPSQDFMASLRPETLPGDIPEAVRTLWQRGEKLAALSLLYRGTVLTAVNRFQIPVRRCDTEQAFLVRVEALDKERKTYITDVVRSWQQIAYANRFPTDQNVLDLLQAWDTVLGNTSR